MLFTLTASLALTMAITSSIDWVAADVTGDVNFTCHYQTNMQEWTKFVALIHEQPELLEEKYSETDDCFVTVGNNKISLKQFTYGGESWPPEPYPKFMIELSDGTVKVRYPLYALFEVEKQWILDHAPIPLLILQRYAGGNCGNCVNYLLISLEADHLFQFIGYVDRVEVANNGLLLERIDDHLGFCMHLGDHVSSPMISVPYMIQDFKIALDKDRLVSELSNDISGFDDQLAKIEQGKRGTDGSYRYNLNALSYTLRKFKCLIYLEKYAEAWSLIDDFLKDAKDSGEIIRVYPSAIEKQLELTEFIHRLEEAYPHAVVQRAL